ncbi:hypothetical protein P154DRAFT_130948 [Amniculicola lignicola CBS 123094]|uniref:Heterokaryon incompatibility domain-containing protein n=1 Tax=Amniculicola lignicola CBS 123094 TaxID=1392246 RepID=A0A6A5WPF7_9PLEO|nr:hypothetical protein P154DRAFT_130948 [Amniculicola lignicola CBS 123094]
MEQGTRKKKEKDEEGDASTAYASSRPRTRSISPRLKAIIPFTSARKWLLYAKLPSTSYIRLLRIHPGPPSSTIYCSLDIAKLDSSLPPYEALSYAWGKKGKNSIICNGWKINDIAPNLFSALGRLRSTEETRVVWVDALCIQQNMKHEKNQQVRHMRQIYRRADRVVVWLGTDDYDEARFAFAILCSLVNENSQLEALKKGRFTSVNKEKGIPDIKSTVSLESAYWTAVLALFSNTWFVRMWVLQEIVLAHSATIIWGSCSISWDVFGQAIDIIRSNPTLHNFLATRNLQNAYFMNRMRRLLVTEFKATYSFLHLLDWARSFDVTNPKDKVYGLLGFPTRDGDVNGDAEMEKGEGKVFIQPEYKLEMREIYTRVARKILSQEQNLDILSFTTHTREPEKEREMWHVRFKKEAKRRWPWRKEEEEEKKEAKPPRPPPSWVPNWNTKTVIYPLVGFEPGNQYRCGTFKKMQMLPSTKSSVLHLKGVIVDTVTDSLPPAPFTYLHRIDPHLKLLIEWCTMHSPASTPSTISRVLTAKRDRTGRLLQSRSRSRSQTQPHTPNTSEDQHLADFLAYQHHLANDLAALDKASHQCPHQGDQDSNDRVREALWRYTSHRSPFVTRQGRLGLGPGTMERGDKVVVFWGGQVPFVLREEKGKERGRGGGGKRWWRFVGECYLEGIMGGEVEGLMGGGKGLREEGFEIM